MKKQEEKPWKPGDPNKSNTYVLPMLGNSFLEFMGDIFPYSNFKNCFIGDVTKKGLEYQDKILLLYKYSGEEKYIRFEEHLKKNPYFLDMYEPDYEHTMYVFDVPVEFEADYQRFKLGKYSKFSKEYKEHVRKFHNLHAASKPVKVLYQSEDLRHEIEEMIGMKLPKDAELSSVPVEDRDFYHSKYNSKKKIKPNGEFE